MWKYFSFWTWANKICILFCRCLSSLHSYKMSGPSSRTEPSPGEVPASTESKSAAAPCWPKCVTAALSDDPLNDSFHVFVPVLSHGVRIWRPSCAEYTDSVFLLSLARPTFLGVSPRVCRNEPRPWCSEYQPAEHLCALFLSGNVTFFFFLDLNYFLPHTSLQDSLQLIFFTSSSSYSLSLSFFSTLKCHLSASAREKLMDWKDFLLVKSKRNITMVSYPYGKMFLLPVILHCAWSKVSEKTFYTLTHRHPECTDLDPVNPTYLEDFPGLIHFICVDRSTGQMIAPSLSITERATSELGKGPVAQFIKRKVKGASKI